MIASPEIAHFTAAGPSEVECSELLAQLAGTLRESFGVAFTLWNADSGELAYASVQQPGCNDPLRGQLARALYGQRPEFLADEDCLVILGSPFALGRGVAVVATAAFVTRPLGKDERPGPAASLLTVEEARAGAWIERQAVWSPDALVRLASSVQARFAA